jgi:hypothetical protein
MNKYSKKSFRTFLLLIFSFLIFNSSFLIGTVRYVSKTGSSIPPYTSWETAADSIQKCINVSFFGDTIYVANGVYQEQVVMTPGLALIGEGSDSCVVDSRGFPLTNNRTITMLDSCLVKGFYIRTSNNFDYGYGIWAIGQNGLITENKFSHANSGIFLWNSNIECYKNYFTDLRIGIGAHNSHATIRKNDIILSEPFLGSGISLAADHYNYKPIIDSNYIETKTVGINKGPGTRSTIRNNIIKLTGSMGSEGIFLHSYFSDSNWVHNNLIYTDLGGYALYTNGSNYLSISNNYVTGNFIFYGLSIGPNHKLKNNVVTYAKGGVEAWGTQNMVFQYNNVWNNEVNYYGIAPDTTNISVDPMVVNDDTTQGDLDFRLQMYSPLIDAGDPTILDRDGSRSDIGLYGSLVAHLLQKESNFNVC